MPKPLPPDRDIIRLLDELNVVQFGRLLSPSIAGARGDIPLRVWRDKANQILRVAIRHLSGRAASDHEIYLAYQHLYWMVYSTSKASFGSALIAAAFAVTSPDGYVPTEIREKLFDRADSGLRRAIRRPIGGRRPRKRSFALDVFVVVVDELRPFYKKAKTFARQNSDDENWREMLRASSVFVALPSPRRAIADTVMREARSKSGGLQPLTLAVQHAKRELSLEHEVSTLKKMYAIAKAKSQRQSSSESEVAKTRRP